MSLYKDCGADKQPYCPEGQMLKNKDRHLQIPADYKSAVQVDNKQPQPPEQKFVKNPRISRLFKFFTWWLIFAGIYASSSVCPFCGRPGCPVGGVGAGLVGGFLALIMEKGKVFWQQVAAKFSLSRGKLRSKS